MEPGASPAEPESTGSTVPIAAPESTDPPEILYHYTTSSGLLGILDNVCLWATDLGYMNDTSELDYGLRLGSSIAVKSVAEWSHVRSRNFNLEPIEPETITNPWRWERVQERTFLGACCFCKDGDSLGQWRGYGGSGGYSIGFRSSALRVLTAAKTMPLRPVIYDRHLQVEALSKLLVPHVATLDPSADLVASAAHISDPHLLADIYLLAAQIKDPAFGEEKEWRIGDMVILNATGAGGGRVSFRASSQGIVPYFIFDLKGESGLLPLESVFVGPGGNVAQRVRAVRAMLMAKGYNTNEITIKASEVPFRDV